MATAKLTGEQIEELKDVASAHFWPHARPVADMSDETGIKLVDGAQGIWVNDVDGKRWVDVLSGMWLVNIGHGRDEIAQAVYDEMTSSMSYSPGGTVTPATVRLTGKLASMLPDPDSRIYLVSGGSEAVETAVKMAKKYQANRGETTRFKVISRKGSYHGATHACMSLGGGGISAPTDYGPLMPGNIHITNPYEYRCHYCADSGGCNLQCAKELDRAIEHENPKTVAAFIGEPISAASGINVPHPEYWPTIREICDKHGVVMICDEVINGFGRTGKMFAVEHWDVTPDIMTVAKALTSGYLPIGATIASSNVADAFKGDEENTFRHLITFGGNPPACAAALRNLEIMEGEGMVENSAEMGNYLFDKLQTLREHPTVGDVRGGMGLLAAVEVVKDKQTKEKFPKEADLAKKLTAAAQQRGLLGRFADVSSFAPPLCITRDEVDHMVDSFEDALTEVEKDLGVS